MIFEIILSLLVVLFIYIVIEYLQHLIEIQKYPAGPFPLPIIGNLHLLSKNAHLDLTNLSKKYGNIYSISFGMQRIVILNNIDTVREAMITKGDIFAGRPKNSYTLRLYTRDYNNLGFSDGLLWRTFRKFAHRSIMSFSGDNFENIDKLIIKESMCLNDRLKRYKEEPVSIYEDLGLSSINIISMMLFGKQYELDDPEFKRILDYNTLTFIGINGSSSIAFLPWLRYFPNDGIKNLKKGIAIRDPLLKQKVIEHKESFKEEITRDITDALLKFCSDERTIQKLGGIFTDNQIEMVLNDLYSGGAETVLRTIEWAVLYMLHCPNYQISVYNELKRVSGSNGYPDITEKDKLPLFHGFINETMRLGTIAPLGLPRKAMEQSSIAGVNIPKGAAVYFNLWNVHHDEQHWEKPFEFRPERWLDEMGQYKPGNHPSFLPFSAGRRVCLGERIAKHELFYFLSRLIIDFEFKNPIGAELPSLEGELGITLTAKPYKCIITRRMNTN